MKFKIGTIVKIKEDKSYGFGIVLRILSLHYVESISQNELIGLEVIFKDKISLFTTFALYPSQLDIISYSNNFREYCYNCNTKIKLMYNIVNHKVLDFFYCPKCLM